jgi:hypothetical protein
MRNHISIGSIIAMPVKGPIRRLEMHLHIALHPAAIAPQLKNGMTEIRP